ncbi:Ig-like domain repeat protein [Nocardioides sp. SOB77]|uniref:Ig-like domain repeat protein n=1 Tax=Nocardioides oceani TaxID=3058369 RepID=A0ABT8FB62_9ACTN|nr:Ig-like domain repeat protein [Nocardioides oceani]MDN4171913.1 Ig-like domain repeat protein [Nocardioides oceani]
MPTHHRALSALATTALLSSGLALGTAGAAEAAPAQPATVVRTQSADGLGDLIALVTNPVLNLLGGVPGVGQAVSVTEPVVDNLLGVLDLDIVWLCDGNEIPGSQGFWTFVPTEAQAGCQLAAKTIATVLGVPISGITSVVEIPLQNLPGAVKSPVATKAVAVPATAKVGTLVAATPPVWDENATDVVTTYQWLRAGAPIAGATTATYTPTAEDLGKALSVRATGTRDKAPEPTVSTSSAVTVAQGDAPTATVQPAVQGVAEVGETLAVRPPTWSGTGTTANTYQWLRDGQPIAGATTATYVVTAADAGRALSARVTGTRTGYAAGTATTAPVTVGATEPLTATVPPSIAGPAVVGQTLTASPGTWNAPGATFTYVWRRDGITIPGATSPTYLTQVADIGRTLSVVVTATAAGFTEASETSRAVSIARLSSTTAASLTSRTVRKGTKATLRIALQAAGKAQTGQVEVHDGQRLLKTVSVAGQRTIKLPRLGVGKHRIRVAYVGSRTTAPSASKVLVLKVVKKK